MGSVAAHIRLRSPWLPWFTFILLIIQVIAPYDAWLILLSGLSGAWLLAFLYLRLQRRQLDLRREVRFGWAQVGDRLEERFTLTNRSWLPVLWVEIADDTQMPGYNASRATGLEGGSQTTWHTAGVCSRRGIFRLGPTRLITSDPLGVYSLEIEYPQTSTLMVTPPVVPLPPIRVAQGGRSGEGRPRPNAPEQTISASGVREFAPGDSLRDIHWRTSARQNQLYVRLLEGSPTGDWWIILDLDARVQVGQEQESTEEHAVILAASLADRGLKARKAVGLAVNGREPIWLPPRQGEGQSWNLLKRLAISAPGPHSLAEMLTGLRPSFDRRASLIIITADMDPAWSTSLLPLLWAGSSVTILLLDPQSYGGQRSPAALTSILPKMGVAHAVIQRDLLDRPEARPGQKGHIQWRVTPSGRAILVDAPGETGWKGLE